MSNLTDAQEKDYTRQIASLLEEYKADLMAAKGEVRTLRQSRTHPFAF